MEKKMEVTIFLGAYIGTAVRIHAFIHGSPETCGGELLTI